MARVWILLALIAVSGASAGSMTIPFDFAGDDGFVFYRHSGYDRIARDGWECFSGTGQPLLPARACCFVIPPGAGDVEVTAVVLETVSLGRGFSIQPAAQPRPFSVVAALPEVIEPDPSVYGGGGPWPANPVVSSHDGSRGGFRLAGFRLCPFIYDPATGEVLLATRISVTVGWTAGPPPAPLSPSQVQAAEASLEGWIDNPADLPVCRPATRQPDAPVDLLVVTSTDYSDSFSSFVSFKNGAGTITELVYISDILASTPGWDNAEKLRNYIIGRYQADGLQHVLLAGDQTIIPVRNVALECEGWTDNSPADLYFSDLDGTWDASGDHSYGQPEDDLDLYSDVTVGRALFDNASEAALFVERSIMYESSPPAGAWQTTAMLCGAGLFPGYTGAKVCDSIAANLPPAWDVNKAYEPPSLLDGFTTHIDVINAGVNWAHYSGHGNTTGVYWQGSPSNMMTNSQAMALYNGDKAGIHHSIGCHPGAFHSGECCAEALWHNAGGGAVSVMFNTSYGWEGYLPEMGISEWMCVYLTEETFQTGNSPLGCAFATAKDRRVPLWSGGHDRELYCLMDWCAFHDPTLTVIGSSTGFGEHEWVPGGPGCAVSLGAPVPNPVVSGSHVAVAASFPGTGATLGVYDLSGRLVLTRSVEEEGVQVVDLTSRDGSLPPGVYVMRLSCGEGMSTARLVVLPAER